MREEREIGRATLPGAGVDRDPAARPGVPRERQEWSEPGPHWIEPEPQPGPDSLGRTGLRIPTPVFGTAQPARGLPGALRRAAYGIPEHRATRWLLLLAADRLDAAAHRARTARWLAPAAVAMAAGYLLVRRALARAR